MKLNTKEIDLLKTITDSHADKLNDQIALSCYVKDQKSVAYYKNQVNVLYSLIDKLNKSIFPPAPLKKLMSA